ncbi:MAG: pilus assembly protein PilZ [Sulfitobacter sp.]|nr:pilus assembly protein PilZ [Sulfitobacter sp.]
MTIRDDQEPTPKKVADLANQEADLDRTALIGIFGSEKAPHALVREGSGEILRVGLGDKVGSRKVAAIGVDHLVLARGSFTKVLRLPKS